MEAHKIDPTTGEDEMALAMAGAETLARHGIGPAADRDGPCGGSGLADDAGAGSSPLGTAAPADAGSASAGGVTRSADPSSWGKVGRNEPCPCGSGKKFKHCHGRYA